MKRSSGARLCATAAIGALSLSLLTACSDDGSKDTADSKPSASASASTSSSAPAGKALTSAELEKLLLAKGDVKGYKVGPKDPSATTSKSALKVDKAACNPIAWATNGLAPGDTDANATNSLTEEKPTAATAQPKDLEDAFSIKMTYVGLSSYEADGAEKTMKALSDGVTACAGGYGFNVDGEASKVVKVAAAKGSGKGEESVAFLQETTVEGQKITAHTEVVRKGGTLATFFTMDVAKLVQGGDMGPVPAAVLDAQVAKLK
ncbi:hypothetical protein [Streptomyces sp. 3214.6]|uniref:hypothetical protein n=1 Tax=Streptomyces sp. 3214.6 TaxID=1882757 RepID=UPI00090C9B4B|nr:hypothetical protein [Streptomyces sp. 3214.6]SHI02269.1 hypothetical protein SAMN05444521_3309 [Streptomyces sp. 3214.6]